MARASARLIEALRETATRLEREDIVYRWSQLAHCNCGHLTQTITGLSPGAIHELAARQRGDWAEQARNALPEAALGLGAPDYGSRPALDEGAWEPDDLGVCPVSELNMTQIFAELGAWGLTARDVESLERLDDPEVRRNLGTHTRDFLRSDRTNVILYMRAWANVLEERLGNAPESGLSEALLLETDLPIAAE
jgi:hypothetical protein